MAIKISKTRYGTRYLALYRNVDGKQKSAGTFSDRKLAEAAYMDAMAKVKWGIDPTRKAESVRPVGTETVESYARRWIEDRGPDSAHDITHNVRLSYVSALRVHIYPVLWELPLGSVSAGDVKQFLSKIDKLGRPATSARVKAVLSALF